MTGSKGKAHNYRELKKAADELLVMHVIANDLPNGEHGKPSCKKINIVSDCEYYDKGGKIVLKFTTDIAPYISDLKNRFTKYEVKNVMRMKSSYAIRLYEIFLNCNNNNNHNKNFSIGEFRKLFKLENKYSRPSELVRGVITPSLKDINKYSDLTVEFTQIKFGRSVSDFHFLITKKKGDAHLQEKFPM
jgi:plasmid replication initiation protein